MLPSWPLKCCAIYRKNIAPCASWNKIALTTHFYLIQILPANILKKDTQGSSINNLHVQSAKCKLKLGEHLLDHQAQNNTNGVTLSDYCAINRQCHDCKIDTVEKLIDKPQFDNFTVNDLIKLQ
jgi:hypothetical protein